MASVGRGASCRATAKALECAISTVVVAVRRYQEDGRQGLRDRREGNGRAKVDERFRVSPRPSPSRATLTERFGE
ncbi:helix-turn-helix domain-containing protein [Corallococcus exiguus]|uniref:helix-turn-helix domain-containing protein n=1 Tax=Corallococcus exiguus TaxID=83462 RepID=UPI003D286CDF